MEAETSNMPVGKAVDAVWPVRRLASSQAFELLPTTARLELRHKTPAAGLAMMCSQRGQADLIGRVRVG